MEQKFLSLNQVAVYLGLSPKTLYTWVEEKRIPAYKLGRVWRFNIDEVDNFVRANSANSNI